MATKYEYFDSGDNTSKNIYGVNWEAQTFTPSVGHYIASIKGKFWRLGSPGTVEAVIRATASGEPSGGDIVVGTIDGNSFTVDTGGAWYEIFLASPYELTGSTKYALIIRNTGGDSSNRIAWRANNAGGYAGGNRYWSANSGSSWDTFVDDFMFEEWSNGAVVGGQGGPASLAIAQGQI